MRSPRLRVLVNGAALPGVVAAEVESSGAFQADRFRVEAALHADPLFGIGFWSAGGAFEIEVTAGFDGSFVSLIVGEADEVELEPVEGVVRLRGRDLSAGLIDAVGPGNFLNQTSGDVARALAARRGLTAAVTVEGGLVGRFYQADRTETGFGRFSGARSEWDLLAELARLEGCAAYVAGRALCFGQASDAPFPVRWDQASGVANVRGLRLRILPGLVGTGVQVRAWHSRDGRAVSASAGGAGRVATVLRANLTESEAEALATRHLAELAAQTSRIGFEMPGELTMTPRTPIQLEGDVGAWAGPYRIVGLSRRFDARAGFAQRVSAVGA